MRQRTSRSFLSIAIAGSVILLASHRPVVAQNTAAPQANESAANLTVQQKIDRLAAALDRAQQQVDQLRVELNALRAEQQRTAQQSATAVTVGTAQPSSTTPTAVATEDAADLARTREEQEMQSVEIRQQQQVKVESESKFPLRVTGLVLFNVVRSDGAVDQPDLPVSALQRAAGSSHRSLAASLRQTWLGLEGTGPILGGAHTSARVDMDFFGGVVGGVTSAPAGIARLRTAAVRAAWAHDLLEARLDSPLISPLSPTSIASVAEPPLAWSGNLWTWATELRYAHTVDLGTRYSFTLEAGLRDAYLANTQVDQVVRASSPAERSGLPTFEGRIAFSDRDVADADFAGYGIDAPSSWDLGLGGSWGRQDYGNGVRVDTWALTGDWRIPLSRWLSLSGEGYTGTGLGSLGGGAYRDVVQGVDPVTGAARTIGLDASGGWAQLSARATPRLQFDAAFGQDSGSGSQLRSITMAPPTNPVDYYARNRTIFGNIMFRPWQSFTISPEYRFLQSWPINGFFNVTHVFTLSAGYQF
jgi:hypothetical protein